MPKDEQLVKILEVGIATSASTGGGNDTQNVNGIVLGHAYSILGYRKVGDHHLVIMCNPHGAGGKEWDGLWSDTDGNWNEFREEKDEIDQHFAATDKAKGNDDGETDGVFCINFRDFRKYFESITYSLNMNLWKESAVELVNFESCVSARGEYWIYKKEEGTVYVYSNLHEATIPVVEFEKENGDSELSITMGQIGARKEIDQDVSFGLKIVSGEACGEDGKGHCFWFDDNIKENVVDKKILYKNQLTCFISGLKTGKYRLICQTLEEGFSGSCQVRIHEEK